jgi:hypothetical protein
MAERGPRQQGRQARLPRAEINAALTERGAIATLATEDATCKCCTCRVCGGDDGPPAMGHPPAGQRDQPKCQCDPRCEYAHLTFQERVRLITEAREFQSRIANRHRRSVLQGELVRNVRIQRGGFEFGPFVLGGISLCMQAYRAVAGWSRNVWDLAKRKVKEHVAAGNGADDPFEGGENSDTVLHREATKRALGWCLSRLDDVADGVDPSSRSSQVGQRMLDRQDLNEWYLEYLQEMEDRGDNESVCPSTFSKMYNQARKELNIMDRKWIPFAQCKECADFKMALSKATSKELKIWSLLYLA